jgi:branched-chain amino acid transport system permease protein
VLGVAIERFVYYPLMKYPPYVPLIGSIAVMLAIEELCRLLAGPHILTFPATLPFPQVQVGGITLSSTLVAVYCITALVLLLLWYITSKTELGLAMRATSQDRDMAMLVGVDVNKVISVTFLVGSATAAIGGVLIASHMGQINYYIGFIAGIKAFVAAVLGGIGSMPGAVLGSLVLGMSESFFTGYISSDYEDVFAFLFLVFTLIFRPSGILGRDDTEKV